MVLTKIEKKIIVISFIVGIILSVAVWFGGHLFFSEEVDSPETSSTTSTEEDDDIVDGTLVSTPPPVDESNETTVKHLQVIDAKNGQADIYVSAETLVSVTAFELYLNIEGDLTISDIVCAANFDCIQEEVINNVVTVIGLTSIQKSPEMSTSVKIATIYYDETTSGNLIINSPAGEESIVTTAAHSNNFLNNATHRFPLGGSDSKSNDE